jgi:hypothetical protein
MAESSHPNGERSFQLTTCGLQCEGGAFKYEEKNLNSVEPPIIEHLLITKHFFNALHAFC